MTKDILPEIKEKKLTPRSLVKLCIQIANSEEYSAPIGRLISISNRLQLAIDLMDGDDEDIMCSGCGAKKNTTKNLIALGPNFNEGEEGFATYICNECINLLSEIVKQESDSIMVEVYNEKEIWLMC